MLPVLEPVDPRKLMPSVDTLHARHSSMPGVDKSYTPTCPFSPMGQGE